MSKFLTAFRVSKLVLGLLSGFFLSTDVCESFHPDGAHWPLQKSSFNLYLEAPSSSKEVNLNLSNSLFNIVNNKVNNYLTKK